MWRLFFPRDPIQFQEHELLEIRDNMVDDWYSNWLWESYSSSNDYDSEDDEHVYDLDFYYNEHNS